MQLYIVDGTSHNSRFTIQNIEARRGKHFAGTNTIPKRKINTWKGETETERGKYKLYFILFLSILFSLFCLLHSPFAIRILELAVISFHFIPFLCISLNGQSNFQLKLNNKVEREWKAESFHSTHFFTCWFTPLPQINKCNVLSHYDDSSNSNPLILICVRDSFSLWMK